MSARLPFFTNANKTYKIMKRTLVVFAVVLLAFPTLAKSNSNDDFGFRFGLKASPNISWFRTETRGYSNSGADLGFSYGLIMDYEFAQNYAISSGLQILRVGGSLKYDYIHDGVTTEKRRDHTLHYLEIPATLKLRTAEMGYITYYGKFGLGLGFNFRAHADDRISLTDQSSLRFHDLDISDETRFLRAALIIGAGLEYSMGGNTALLGGITYHNGFSNIIDKENPAVPNKPSVHMNYFEITLGIMF